MPLRVNGQVVEDEVIRKEALVFKECLKREAPDEEALTIEIQAREWARENVIREVLLQQAASQSSPADLLAGIARDVGRPSGKDVAGYYRKFQALFESPELVRAAHIVKNVNEEATEEEALAEIREIERELKSGAEFSELADRRSDCRVRGGDLGFFKRGEMVEEFENAVWFLRPGETSEIFRSCFGFHIGKLIERRPKGLRPLNEVRGEIEEQLWKERKERAVEEFMRGLRARAVIQRV